MADDATVGRSRASYRDEVDSAAIYRAIADEEDRPSSPTSTAASPRRRSATPPSGPSGVLPFALAAGTAAILASLALSAVALFAIGGGITLFTGRGLRYSGGRQVVVGLAAAALTFGVGRLIGIAVVG